MKTLTGHSRGVVCLEQFVNGYLISGANDNTIKGFKQNFIFKKNKHKSEF